MIGLYADELHVTESQTDGDGYLLATVLAADAARRLPIAMKGFKSADPADLNGFELCPAGEHDFIYARLQVWEGRLERAGATVARMRERLEKLSLGRRLAAGQALRSLGVAAVGASELLGAVAELLRRNGDELLLDVETKISFFKNPRSGPVAIVDGGGPHHAPHTFELVGERALLKLRLAGEMQFSEEDFDEGVEAGISQAKHWPDPPGLASEKRWSKGDLVQWETGGVLGFPEPKTIKRIKKGFAFFEGSETGVPLGELVAPMEPVAAHRPEDFEGSD